MASEATTDEPMVRRSSRLDRWLTAREVPRTGRTGPTTALVKVGFVYILGFGLPIYSAIRYLSSAHVRLLAHTTVGWRLPEIVGLSLVCAAVVVAAMLLAREAPAWWRPNAPGPRWRSELRAFGLAWTALLTSAVVGALLGMHPYPRSHAAASAWPATIGALLAGPAEEIVVLAAPMVFLRAAKRPWWQVILAGLALRLAYHVYYGIPAVALGLWALVVILVYLRTHAVIGLIVAHSYWDVTAAVAVYWSGIIAVLIQLLTLLAVILWAIVSTILWLIRRSRRKQAAMRAASGPVGWYQNSGGQWWWWDGQNWIAPPGDA